MKRLKKKHKWIVGICSFTLCFACIVMFFISVKPKNMEYIGDVEIPLSYNDPSLVIETEADYRVIPDKYNTGATGELTVVGLGDMVGEIQLVADGSGTRNVLDFFYRNKTISGSIIIENMDFSAYPVLLYHSDMVDRSITLEFNNCKFSMISVGKVSSEVSCVFNNCTFQLFTGSDATFIRCKFGDHYSDCLVPFQNVLVQDSFFSNLSVVKTAPGEEHSDGTQLYGHADVPLYNVTYDNCRFEIPAIESTRSNAFVNACFMLQLEYNDASNILLSNCILNGGGYSIYAWSKSDKYTMEDVVLENIKVGCGQRYGIFYPKVSDEVVRENITETDGLYVASVWKENGETHFSVTNDTNRERSLLILTDKGRFYYTIPACPRGADLQVNSSYEDLPFDLDIVVPNDCEYAVCYDTFISGAAKQIRFVNWTEDNVYLTEEELDELFSAEGAIWQDGPCGDDAWYELDTLGVLTIRGTGATYNYHSAKRAPWYDYRELIKEIVVEEGISGLGAQLFNGCVSVQNVELPKGLLYIGQRSFNGCIALQHIYWPSTLQSVGYAAFMYDLLDSIQYAGIDISDVEIDAGEIEVINDILEYVIEPEIVIEIIDEGECGDDCTYTLYNDGTLVVSGTGEMYNYHSLKTAPWYKNRESIYQIVLEDGIQTIGNQAFRNCTALCEVVFPDSLVSIGANAFINCSSLFSISLPNSIEEIQAWAFSGTDITFVYYAGTAEEWYNVKIGGRNDNIINGVIFEE